MKKIISLFFIALSFQAAHGTVWDSPEFDFDEDEGLSISSHDDEDDFEDRTFFDIINLTFFYDFSKVEISIKSIENSIQTHSLLDNKIVAAQFTKFQPITPKQRQVKKFTSPAFHAKVEFNFKILFTFSKNTRILTLTLKDIDLPQINLPLSYSEASNLIHDEKEIFLTYLLQQKPMLLRNFFNTVAFN